jgi:hypothetical protein
MIMSSLIRTEDRSFFVLQSGIVGWEDPRPMVDWQRKTVSIVSGDLVTSMSMLWPIIARRPSRFGRVLRISVAPIPNPMNELQKRRLKSQLMVAPPGFSDPTVEIGNDRACALSELVDSFAIEADFLTAYRSCLLVEFDDNGRSKSTLTGAVCQSIRDFGNDGIVSLLDNMDDLVALRILNLESHSVVQVIGPMEASDAAVSYLTEKGIRRIHDIRDIPQEIAKFRI